MLYAFFWGFTRVRCICQRFITLYLFHVRRWLYITKYLPLWRWKRVFQNVSIQTSGATWRNIFMVLCKLCRFYYESIWPKARITQHPLKKSLPHSVIIMTKIIHELENMYMQLTLTEYRIFPSIARTLYFSVLTCCIDTAHLKIHGIVRLAVARPVFRYFTSLGPRKCVPLHICSYPVMCRGGGGQKTKHYSASLGYKIKAKITTKY
jgi:hypothetical protein